REGRPGEEFGTLSFLCGTVIGAELLDVRMVEEFRILSFFLLPRRRSDYSYAFGGHRVLPTLKGFRHLARSRLPSPSADRPAHCAPGAHAARAGTAQRTTDVANCPRPR